MAYERTNWKDSPSTDTPITASNLNNIESGIVNLQPYIIYDNSIGTTGTVSYPDDTWANYSIVDILCKTNDGDYLSTRIYNPIGKTVLVSASNVYSNDFYVKLATLKIESTKISFTKNYEMKISGTDKQIFWYTGEYIFLTKLIGYK